MHKAMLIAQHEFLKHLRRPSFIILTLAVPLVGLIITLVAGGLNRSNDPTQPPDPFADIGNTTIGYVDHAGLITTTPEDLPPDLFRAFDTEDAAQAAVEAGDLDTYYVIADDYVQSGTITRFAPEVGLGFEDEGLIDTLLRANLLSDQEPQVLQRIDNPVNSAFTRLDTDGQPAPVERGDATPDDSPLTFFVPYVFAMLLFFTIISASSFMMQSVTEEKENRTIELLLTSLKPWQMLGGKVAGLGALGLLQMIVWLGTARLLLFLSTGQLGLFEGFTLPTYVLVLAVVYFLLGYLVSSSMMAGLGATVSTTREGSQLTMLVIFPFLIPLWFLGAIIAQPNGMLATILSLFPLTAPVTMVMRITLTDVVWWHIALSVLLLAGTVVLVIWGAARLFRVTTLLAGKRFSPREIMQAVRS